MDVPPIEFDVDKCSEKLVHTVWLPDRSASIRKHTY